MNGAYARFADLILVCVLSVVDLAVYFVEGSNPFTDLVSVLFIVYVPGYLIVELIPYLNKNDPVERLMISFGISVSIGAASFYLAFGVLGSASLAAAALGSILLVELLIPVVLYRRIVARKDKEHGPLSSVAKGLASDYRSMGKGKKTLAIVSVLVIVAVTIASAGLLATVSKEHYSEFYILNDKGQAYDIPHNFQVGAEAQTVLGVANHEGRTVTYYVEVWLVNYTLIDGAVKVYQMYSYSSMNVTLGSTDVDLNKPWAPQYEGLVPLNFTIPGDYSLFFMLFKDSPEPGPARPFNPTANYATDADATWRIVETVNNKIQFLKLNIHISPA